MKLPVQKSLPGRLLSRAGLQNELQEHTEGGMSL